jgi:hypothetical protein
LFLCYLNWLPTGGVFSASPEDKREAPYSTKPLSKNLNERIYYFFLAAATGAFPAFGLLAPYLERR